MSMIDPETLHCLYFPQALARFRLLPHTIPTCEPPRSRTSPAFSCTRLLIRPIETEEPWGNATRHRHVITTVMNGVPFAHSIKQDGSSFVNLASIGLKIARATMTRLVLAPSLTNLRWNSDRNCGAPAMTWTESSTRSPITTTSPVSSVASGGSSRRNHRPRERARQTNTDGGCRTTGGWHRSPTSDGGAGLVDRMSPLSGSSDSPTGS